MRRISIVANNEDIAHCIVTALPENTCCCQLLSPTEVEFKPISENSGPLDMLIIDLASTNSLSGRFFTHLNCKYPEITIIMIVPAERFNATEAWKAYGVDEIVLWPEDAAQTREMTERIRAQFANRDQLQLLQERLRREMNCNQITVRSRPMREIMHQLPQFSACTSTILISGETGTGKELLARAIHYLGPRAGQPFITVDCGAIPDSLVENELFGHVRGAYTDASSPAKGLIQEADGGTLFLDEIEALPMRLQAKFLRFLQERQFKPLGQSKYISVNVRVLAATNINLASAVAQKNFREDLYYRLNVVPLFIPPLRERRTDIPVLVRSFLQKYGEDQQAPRQIPDETLQVWMEYDWPGNVRELENKVQQWLVHPTSNNNNEAWAFSSPTHKTLRPFAKARQEAITRFERDYLDELLSQTHGNISAAARLAKTDRKHIRALLKKNGIVAHYFRK